MATATTMRADTKPASTVSEYPDDVEVPSFSAFASMPKHVDVQLRRKRNRCCSGAPAPAQAVGAICGVITPPPVTHVTAPCQISELALVQPPPTKIGAPAV